MTQALQHEVLEVEHAIASRPSRGAQELQCIGVTIEKIWVLAQIRDDLAGADLDRPHGRRKGPANRLWLVLRTIGHVYFRRTAPTGGCET